MLDANPDYGELLEQSEEDSEWTDCPIHGKAPAAYVCQHLVNGKKRGFVTADDDETRSDAWCDKCNDVLEEEGEWNDRSEAFAGVTLVCGYCYDEIKKRNALD